ncbi:hypothetical protein ACB098_05G215400 [Castanea mollissima]
MVDTGLEAYRFSISWSRLIPRIQPYVTLHHSDLPQALEEKYGGWLNRNIVRDFTAYADVCFRKFGDRVLHWTTMNEGNVFALGGYNHGSLPPQHCSLPFGVNCTRGNSSTEPYLASHNILLAHTSAARLYKENVVWAMQDKQHGFIGINLLAIWFIPLTNKTEDAIATQRAKDFMIGWYADPLVYGDYPDVMKKIAGSRLPAFTNLESNQVKGSFDFLGLNYYFGLYIKDNSSKLSMEVRDFFADMAIEVSGFPNNISVVEFPIVPSALQELLQYFKQAYGNPPIYIRENGQQTQRNSSLEDEGRVNYLHGHIGVLLDALRNGSNARGYFQWAFLDVLELLDGYESSYGLYYVDLDDPDLKRQPKLSAHWYSHFLKSKGVSSDGFIKLEKNLTALSHDHFSHLNSKQHRVDKFSRDDFPPDFVFGSGTSAYQVEGAANEDGRGPSIWDSFSHSGKMHGGNGDIACDQYHKYKDDVQLMVDTGLEAYRFSISWSRLIPNGRGPVNPKGLQYYNNLINELSSNGIQPHVTLHHSDFPQALEDKYGGWVSRKMVKDFTAYADVCFRNFGDRVLHWITMNEANVFAMAGYESGSTPPEHCSPPFGINCTRGNSSTEPYLATHHILLAHASAARLYKEKYQDKQHGFIGINLLAFWVLPLTNKTEDVIAAQRAMDFQIGWYADPLVYGDYPDVMKKNVGSRLPAFTNLESNLVKGSFDFLGLNYYAMIYIKDDSSKLNMEVRDFDADMAVSLSAYLTQFPTTPWALQELLEYFKQAYGNPPIYIHENGQKTQRNSSLEDESRVNYLHGHIGALLDALRNGSNTRGYFQWAFLDVLELLDGYESSFGLYYVDLDDPDLKRQPKLSAHWYSHFLKTKGVSSDGFIKLEKNLTAFSHAHFSR